MQTMHAYIHCSNPAADVHHMLPVQGGRSAHKGNGWGIGSGEGPSISNATRHTVKIHNHHANQEVVVEVPEDR